jgi:UDP-N-acetyl-D-mannosaminuronic acid dehydrogenase
MCNFNYPRGQIKKPGLTGGTCLRKDFGMLNERSAYSDIFLSAWKINEFMPNHIANTIVENYKIENKTVGILGCAFKKNSDDLRESLVPKLIRQLEKKVPGEILLSEPNLKDKKIFGYQNVNYEKILKKANIIIIAINHKRFNSKIILNNLKKNQIVVDIWNHLNKNQFFFKK